MSVAPGSQNQHLYKFADSEIFAVFLSILCVCLFNAE